MTNTINTKTYALFQTPNNKKLIEHLRQHAANVFLFPPVKTEIAELSADAASLLNDLGRFDWIVFTDVFAVDYFIETLEANGIDLFELDKLRVCALGESVCDRLRFSQIHSDVIPNKIVSEEIVKMIAEYAEREGFDDLKFLIVKSTSAQLDLIERLKARGAKTTELPIHKIEVSVGGDTTKLKVLLNSGAVDEFVFSSAEDVLSFEACFLDGFNFTANDMVFTANTETALETLKEHGFSARHFYLETGLSA